MFLYTVPFILPLPWCANYSTFNHVLFCFLKRGRNSRHGHCYEWYVFLYTVYGTAGDDKRGLLRKLSNIPIKMKEIFKICDRNPCEIVKYFKCCRIFLLCFPCLLQFDSSLQWLLCILLLLSDLLFAYIFFFHWSAYSISTVYSDY